MHPSNAFYHQILEANSFTNSTFHHFYWVSYFLHLLGLSVVHAICDYFDFQNHVVVPKRISRILVNR